jgi:hypothetical protein
VEIQALTATEEYDGTSWSPGGNLGTARQLGGAGTQTSGVAFGGNSNYRSYSTQKNIMEQVGQLEEI